MKRTRRVGKGVKGEAGQYRVESAVLMLDSARWSWPRAAARREIELTVELLGRGGGRGVKNDVVHYDSIVSRTPNMTRCRCRH